MANGGSESTYVSDTVTTNNSGPYRLSVGGDTGDYGGRGLFCFVANMSATNKQSVAGSRLIYIP